MKGDQIKAIYFANVAHDSSVNGLNNATSAIDGSVNTQLSTIKGCSLEQLFQRIGEVLSKMVANAGGSIVPSIRDDSGRNRVEFNISVTADQHNNVASLQAGPKDERSPGTQRKATGENYSKSLEDDSERTESPATFRRSHRELGKDFEAQLSPVVQGTKTTSFEEGKPHSDEMKYGQSKFEGQHSSAPISVNLAEASSRQLEFGDDESDEDFDPQNKTDPGDSNYFPYPIASAQPRRYPNNDDAHLTDSDEELSSESRDGKPEYNQQISSRFLQPTGPRESHLEGDKPQINKGVATNEAPQWDHDQINTSPSEQMSQETDVTLMTPYSDLPHVHNGNNYAEIISEDVPTITGARLYPADSARQYDRQHVDIKAPIFKEDSQVILNRGMIPLDTSPVGTGRRTRQERQYNLLAQEESRRTATLDQPQKYSGNRRDIILERSRYVAGHPLIPTGARNQQSVKQPRDNVGMITSQRFPSSDSDTAYFDNSRALTKIEGGRLHYPDTTHVFLDETQRAFNPLGEALPSDFLRSPVDIHGTFKQDLTDAINDIGSTKNDGVLNAFINPAEEDPHFPEDTEPRYCTIFFIQLTNTSTV